MVVLRRASGILLSIILVLLQAVAAQAGIEEDKKWALDIAKEAKKTVLRSMEEKHQELLKISGEEGRVEDYIDPPASLRVFVSSAMPKEALRVFVREVRKYGGSIVFKGLPGGSFRQLAKLVMDIAGEDSSGMQIDDEAFERFGILKVPVIILSKEENCLYVQNCRIVFDKVAGNIGIRRALEEFASKGELADEAKRLLLR